MQNIISNWAPPIVHTRRPLFFKRDTVQTRFIIFYPRPFPPVSFLSFTLCSLEPGSRHQTLPSALPHLPGPPLLPHNCSCIQDLISSPHICLRLSQSLSQDPHLQPGATMVHPHLLPEWASGSSPLNQVSPLLQTQQGPLPPPTHTARPVAVVKLCYLVVQWEVHSGEIFQGLYKISVD